jgi:hypothetical protein
VSGMPRCLWQKGVRQEMLVQLRHGLGAGALMLWSRAKVGAAHGQPRQGAST